MKLFTLFLSTVFIACVSTFSFSQRGKDGVGNVSAANTQVNTYATVTATGTNTVTVSNIATLTGGIWPSTAIAAGDLIMIIQMQGASMDVDVTPTATWGGNYTVPGAYLWTNNWNQFPQEWGKITAYNNAGKFEQVEVRSVAGNVITLQCNLQNTYTTAGHVQVVRIPRYTSLTLTGTASIVSLTWNGNIGGVVSVEVNGDIVLNAGTKISASTRGFRGGVADNTGTVGSVNISGDGAGNGSSYLGSNLTSQGARKGEGIGGFTAEYDLVFSRYGRGSAANGGGGGGIQNSGGGGGANVAANPATYNGKGVPSPTASSVAWNLEMPGFAGTTSPGGGRGGYSLSTVNVDATITGPNNTAWSPTASDTRKVNGGLGGHPLVYDASRLFMGGGGGAGDQDSGQGGAGGAGGGIVFVTCYGNISGSGSLESDGAVGGNTNPNNQAVSPFPGTANKKGNDGAGGGGAGGSIYVKNQNAIPATISLNARGGAGGNVVLTVGLGSAAEGSGPGGAGAGGSISLTSGVPVQNVSGGNSGTTNSAHLTEFTPNGATNGASGISGSATTLFNITPNNQTICAGTSVVLTVNVTGTLPGQLTWYTTPFGTTTVATNTNAYVTPNLTSTTTYYVGVCPGTFRVPVTVTVNPAPTISGTAVLTNPTCSTPGSITGLTASGGTPTLTYSWSGTTTPNANLNNVVAGTYTLTVTDVNGCFATSGPYTLSGIAGPIVNSAAAVINDQSCNGTLGSITGITATGTGLTYSWSNGGGTALNPSNLVAGNYTLTVTDVNGCAVNAGPFTIGFIAAPTINASAVIITPSTCGNANGSITGITTTGSGLIYSWNGNAATGPTLSSQLGGNFTLTITDVNGCTASSSPFTIPSIAGPTINSGAVAIVNENCNQANGSISGITISGGTNPIGIVWTNTAQTTLDLTGLAANNYTLTITDANACTATSGPYAVINTGSPVITSSGAVIVNENCNGTMGSISGITTAGTGLSYSWSNGGGTALNPSNLAANSYTLTVTDINGCTSTAGPFTVSFVAGPSVNTGSVVVNATTCGNNNGSITGITATGTGLTYAWNGNSSAAPTLNNQPSGNYSLVITDANGCTANSGPYNIAASSSPVVNASTIVISDAHCGLSDGALSGLTISGGSPNYTYSWTGTPQSTLNLTALVAGSYTLTVTDQAGCTAQAGPFQVSNINGPSINETNATATNVLCDGTLGSITGITSSGTNLTYSWSNGGGSGLNATGLTPGIYTLTVSDAFGCSVLSVPYTITAPIPLVLDASAMVVTPTSCVGNTGSISGLVITGGVNPQVDWSNNQGTLNLTGLAVGTYNLSVTDDQGCSQELTVSIVQNNAPVIDTTNMVITTAHCGQADGTVTGITVSGGTPSYSYSWNTAPASATLNIGGAQGGTYTLTVTDSQGCSDNETIAIGNAAAAQISDVNLQLVQPTCLIPGSINGLQASGNGPFTYSWTSTAQAVLNPSALPSGSYDLTVTDAFGCTTQYGPVVLDEPVGPIADFSWTPSSPNIGQTVDFTDNSTGTNIITWNWLIDTAVFVGQAPQFAFDAEGLYDVTLMITDANGCMDTLTQVISIYGQVIIPNVLTSNGDGVNDTFEIQNLKPETNVLILNRWGDVVFETTNYQNDWGGQDVSGQDLVDGVYTYLVKTPENKQYHGFIHLIRSK